MQEILAIKGIHSLFHFTQIQNLPSIMEHGLIPRSALNQKMIDFDFNDSERYDDCENAVCTSIMFPNYKMFYLLRQKSEASWVVLSLNSNAICDFKCAFCRENAGSASMFNQLLEDRMGKDAFLALFNDLPTVHRCDLNIPSYYPTNPQAEVLIFDTIPISYINHIYFDNLVAESNFESCIPNSIPHSIDHRLFGPRSDYNHW